MKIKNLVIICMICIFASIIFSTSVLAQETEEIIDIDLIVNQDDSVIENWIILTEGIRTKYL